MNKHQYKNLILDLPSDWTFENEEGDIEACFDPKSKSTFRIHLITAKFPEDKPKEELLKSLSIGGILLDKKTKRNYLFGGPKIVESVEQGQDICVYTWTLTKVSESINIDSILVVFTYTFLKNELDLEKNNISLLENSFFNAELE